MPWPWTPRATRFLARSPRRSTTFWDEPLASVTDLEQAYASAGQVLPPAIREFQQELCGVTYPTAGEDGDWFLWGIAKDDAALFGDLEPGEEMLEICGQYQTAVPSRYRIQADGRIEDTGCVVADHARVLVERLAYDDDRWAAIRAGTRDTYTFRVERVPRTEPAVHAAFLAVVAEWGGEPVPETHDSLGGCWEIHGGYLCAQAEVCSMDEGGWRYNFTVQSQAQADHMAARLRAVSPLPALEFRRAGGPAPIWYAEPYGWYPDGFH